MASFLRGGQRRLKRTGGLTVGIVVSLLAAGCAVVPAVAGDQQMDWVAPGWGEVSHVRLVQSDLRVEGGAEPDASTAETADARETERDGAQSDDTYEDELAPASGEPAEKLLERQRELNELGLVAHRIRNDDVSIHARWVYLPGEHPFNSRMDELVWAAISATGQAYEPQVFDVEAGLSERGCVAGSLAWSAHRVLSDPLTGPNGGVGTAVTCEIAAVFGDFIGVGMRVVTGAGEDITDDTRVTVYANLATGELVENSEKWNTQAAPELWAATAELLRREAGALSRAELAQPDEHQIALAGDALTFAQVIEDGELLVTLPAGFSSPELERLGVGPTTAPVQVVVDAPTTAEWATFHHELIDGAASEPFVGVPAWTASTHLNCALVPCIAVTYDDGPSEYTPRLLGTLRQHQSPATFYMIGTSVQWLPETVREVAADGHEIASHTMGHPNLPRLTSDQMRSEVFDAANLITAATGVDVTSYRPPYGAIDDDVMEAVQLPAILWSIDTNDWQKPGTETLLDRSLTPASPGDIVLFHDIHRESVDVADELFKGLRNRGFVAATVTQLFDGHLPSGKVVRR